MIELPEATSLAQQLNRELCGKRISSATAATTPHKFAWYCGDPSQYGKILNGSTVDGAASVGGMLEIKAGSAVVLFADGISLRYYSPKDVLPVKHQLLIRFEDRSCLSAAVQMYGGLWCFVEGSFDNPYYTAAKEKPSPLTDRFDWDYFEHLISMDVVQKLSAKAFLATEQRIPGLGNGVLQDILHAARIHPKRKIATLSQLEREQLYSCVKEILRKMTVDGGRDSEKDLFGKKGGYKTKMSKYTVGSPCPDCGRTVEKQSYLGGSVYFCAGCQPL